MCVFTIVDIENVLLLFVFVVGFFNVISSLSSQ